VLANSEPAVAVAVECLALFVQRVERVARAGREAQRLKRCLEGLPRAPDSAELPSCSLAFDDARGDCSVGLPVVAVVEQEGIYQQRPEPDNARRKLAAERRAPQKLPLELRAVVLQLLQPSLARVAQRAEAISADQSRIGDDRTQLFERPFEPPAAALDAVETSRDSLGLESNGACSLQARAATEHRFCGQARDSHTDVVLHHHVRRARIDDLGFDSGVARDQPNALQLARAPGQSSGCLRRIRHE